MEWECKWTLFVPSDFNNVTLSPPQYQVAHDINKFKHKLRKFLIENSFYSAEEYLDRNNKFDLGVSQ
jgi:hypothetical protein